MLVSVCKVMLLSHFRCFCLFVCLFLLFSVRFLSFFFLFPFLSVSQQDNMQRKKIFLKTLDVHCLCELMSCLYSIESATKFQKCLPERKTTQKRVCCLGLKLGRKAIWWTLCQLIFSEPVVFPGLGRVFLCFPELSNAINFREEERSFPAAFAGLERSPVYCVCVCVMWCDDGGGLLFRT